MTLLFLRDQPKKSAENPLSGGRERINHPDDSIQKLRTRPGMFPRKELFRSAQDCSDSKGQIQSRKPGLRSFSPKHP